MTDAGRSAFHHRGFLIVAAVALAALLWWLLSPSAPPPKAAAPVPVVAGRVEVRDVPLWLAGVGTVQSLHNVTLRPQIDGVLTEVLFREGQQVSRGQLLARIDDRAIVAALQQARAEQARIEAQLKVAELDLTRYGNLLQDEAVSRQTLEQQRALVDELKAALRANAASIAVNEVQLSYTRITAPVSGRVGLRRVDAGNLVRASDAGGLTTVTQVDPISVVFSLPQQHLPQLQALLQQPSRAVPVLAFDRDAATPLAQGHLVMIDNAIDTATGTLKLRAQFTNSEGRLWPGQFVSVQLLAATLPSVVVIDSRALRRGLDGSYVLRIVDGKARVVAVETVYEDDTIVALRAGLAADDLVVVDGHSRVIADASVAITDTHPAPARATDAVTVAQPASTAERH